MLTVNDIPDRDEGSQEFDDLRPDFMEHVISPLAHTAVVATVDSHGDRFLAELQDAEGDEVRRLAGMDDSGNSEYRPDIHAVDGLIFLEQSFGSLRTEATRHPVWDILTARQQKAAERFTVFSVQSSPDLSLVDQSATIVDTVRTIHERHPELELADTTKMAAFLRHPLTPSIFRGFAVGGNAFPDSLRGRNIHPAGAPWRENPEKPVLDMSGEHPRTSRELRNAAYEHRKVNERTVGSDLDDYGVEIGQRYSNGCPVRHLNFRTDVPSLRGNRLQLGPFQIGQLMSVERPAIQPVDANNFRIQRDALAVVSGLYARGLEIIAA